MSKPKFCCSTKQYYSQAKNLVETLIIVPRVIICKKIKKWQEYTETITIKNKGMYPRNLIYSTDSAQDLKLIFPFNWDFDHLQPDDIIEIKIVITPTEDSVRNACRHVYIQSEHPNITFEIPIIVLNPTPRCYMPKSIDFPSTVPGEITYYEFAVFNPANKPQTIALKSSLKSIKVLLSKDRIPPRDCKRILLTYQVTDDKVLQDILKFKVESDLKDINVIHIPATVSLYLNTNNLIFEELKYERESSLTFNVCNELPIDVNLKITFLNNEEQLEETHVEIEKAREQASSYISIFSTINYQQIEETHFSLVAYKHFNVVENASVKGHDSIELTVLFHPVTLPECDFDDSSLTPHKVRTKLIMQVGDISNKYRKSVNISGFIKGPEVEIYPKEIRLRKIYMGEEHCELVKVLNVDGKVNAQVNFLDVIYPNTAGAVVEPTYHDLEPCKSGLFRVSFFAKVVGAFIAKLRFKVKNGEIIETTLKGQSVHARLRIFPDVLQFGVIPFGVPCKRLVLLVNPFLVPVTVQVTVGDDGDETPLVLNVEDADGLQPITVKDYVTAMLEMVANENEDSENEEGAIELISKSDSMLSYRSASSINSSCSSTFEKQILDAIPDFAFNIVKRIKKNRYLEHKEVEDCIVSEALEMLLSTDYFGPLKKFSNYAQMDWNVLPFNPKEVYCDKEVIYLLPNAGKSVTVILVPNRVGECNRALYVRICPINEEGADVGNVDDNWDLRGKFFVNSKLMTSKIWMEYVCRLPDISFTQDTSYEDDTIYVEQEVNFAMLFRNLSNVGGFFYYDIAPAGEYGEMIFKDNITKYFIPPLGKTTVEGHLLFNRVGKVKLSGLVKIVGSLNGSPFHIYADIKPVRIQLSSTTIYKRQKVLESTVAYLFIDNDTPTVTKFTMKLKNNKYQSIDPSGAILSPEGQGIYVSIFSKFYDADTYYNTLIIDVSHGTTTIEVPITYVVEGSPINMEPNVLDDGHDCGTIMINCQDTYDTDIPKYIKEVKLNNKGKHTYCFYIDKLRNNLAKCAIERGHGYLTVSPKVVCLEPETQGTIYITADSSKAGTLYSEFMLRAIDQEHKLKVHSTRFAVTATFVEPEIHWCHKIVELEYNRTHVYQEHPVLAMARLKNVADVDCKVLLKVLGPFRIKLLFEHNLTKVITFPMKGFEEKEITIALHKTSIRDEICSSVNGRILCEANCKLQRSLPLKLVIRSPKLRLAQTDMILFSRGVESLTYVELNNIANLDAQYKWKKVEEKTDYVADHDDTYQFSHDILSEILRMLDLSDSETESDDERNMTLRYQRYRCKLEQLEDTIGVADIIDEIIDNLNLEHKRYAKLDVDDSTCLSSRCCSSGEFVRKTVNDVLFGLKLEDSYNVSQESIEECDDDRKIHFVEKSGIVKKFATVQTPLFLPAVKPGYAKIATFILDVVGSCPQQFDITLINLERVMVFSSESVYLGIKPWYELFHATVRIINVTQYPITVSVQDKTVVDKNQRLYAGYAKVRGDSIFDICKFKSKLLKADGTMGFSEQFMHEIQVTANKSEERTILLRGQGIMPIISITTKLPHPEQTIHEILDEYELLQTIYYLDVFKSITEYDDDVSVAREEGEDAVSSLLATEYSISTINAESVRSVASSRQARFFRLMKTYVIVNNNGELPHARVLEQLMETRKFIKQLKENPKAVHMLRKVYQNYEQMIKSYDEALPINLKHFTTQPLPFQQQGLVLNMNSLILGQLRKFKIDLHFYGPGKLIACVRTEVKIPGLYVDFEVEKSEDHDYIFYAAEKKSASLFGKRYRNMFERTIDAEIDPKVKHAHSFDLDKSEHHTRLEVGAKQRKELQNYYNSLNKSVYEDHKHHFTLCKIFSNSKTNYFSGEASILMLIKPDKKYYEEGQIIEDYLYIDLHLGPTVPILLRGLITKK